MSTDLNTEEHAASPREVRDLSSKFTIALKYGAIGGVVLIGMFFLVMKMGENPLVAAQRFPMAIVVFPFVIGFALYEYKIYGTLDLQMRLAEGVGVGFMVYVLATGIFLTFEYIYLADAGADVLDTFRAYGIEKYTAEKDAYILANGKEDYARLMKQIVETPVKAVIFDDAVKKVGVGFVVTFVYH